MRKESNEWTTVITAGFSLRDLSVRELWKYRDLIYLFVKRNFAVRYKQTILGPAWILISPLIGTLISTFVFGNIAKISSEGVPYFLFYMCASVIWTYFAWCLNSTSSTFINNSGIFGKVYFPRLAVPVSSVITGMIDFCVQFLMFLAFLLYFYLTGAEVSPNICIIILPLLVMQTACLGMGVGIIVSALTAKYRDLQVLVSFGVTLWMYITPVIYSTASLPENIKRICMLNPMAPVTEIMRYAFLGVGDFPAVYWIISLIVTVVVLVIGVILFGKVEKNFIDTV